MLHTHIYVLLGIISHRHHFSLGGLNWASGSGHFEFLVLGSDYAHDGLAIFENYVKRLGGNDGHYRAPREFYIAGEFGLQLQFIVVSFNDGTAQAISIFQSDLIGDCGGRADRQNQQQEHISSQSNSPCVGRSSMGLAGLTNRARRKRLFDFT
jgi:hypothetical protein